MKNAIFFWIDEQFIVFVLLSIICLYCITMQSFTRKQLSIFINDTAPWDLSPLVKWEPGATKKKKRVISWR